jgi:hypothetical protein
MKYHAANTIPPTKLANCCKIGEDVNEPGDELVLTVAAGAAVVFTDADDVAEVAVVEDVVSFPSDDPDDAEDGAAAAEVEDAGVDVVVFASSELEEEAGAVALLEELDPAGDETSPKVPPTGPLPGGVTLLEVPSAAF